MEKNQIKILTNIEFNVASDIENSYSTPCFSNRFIRF